MVKRNEIPGWIKWTLGVTSLVLMGLLIFGIYLYQAVQENRTATFDRVKEQVLSDTELTSIENIERFHGENAYYTVYGNTDNEEAKIIFYPFDQDESNLISLNQSEIAAKETILADWNNRCNSCTIIDIIPAVHSDDNVQPAWEITYEDKSGRYVLEYLSIMDGSIIEVLRFNRLFDGESD